ncbi:Ribonuclease H domain [Dillenia turbinata]|uniref:Ribonuclease H domain n=1 Tax=Dillenia turbinata TaxID=194707 RepID=A0AAN8ZEA6_9MAGN
MAKKIKRLAHECSIAFAITKYSSLDQLRWVGLEMGGSRGKAGSLIRDHEGNWIVESSSIVECSNILATEIKGLWEGLMMAKRHNLKGVEDEADLADLVKMHMLREDNWYADKPAKMGMRGFSNVTSLDDPLSLIEDLLMEDARSFLHLRA